MIVCLLLPYAAAALVRREHRIEDSVPLMFHAGQQVTATCAAASSSGVRPGMSLRQARWLCPSAQVLPANRPLLRQTLDEVIGTLGQFTHRVEADGSSVMPSRSTAPVADGRQSLLFYVDLERLALDDSVHLAQQMGATVRQATGLDSACGLAVGKSPAYAAASGVRPGHVRVIAPGEEAAFLAPLPITLLPLSPEHNRRLQLLGLETIGALADLSASALLAQCGKAGTLLHHLSRGMDFRRVVPTEPQVVERVTREFEMPISDRQVLDALLRSVATELSIRLQASGWMGRTLVLTFGLEDSTLLRQQTRLRTPASSSRFLAETLRRLAERISFSAGVCRLVVTVADLVPFAGQQLELFPDQPKPREQLQQRLKTLLARPDAPDFFWVTPQDVAARRIEHRYRFEHVVPL